jgi:hypothetical protein
LAAPEATHVNEDARNQAIAKLNELRAQLAQRLGGDRLSHDPLAAQVDELRALLEQATPDEQGVQTSASGLERRLLAWEAEHPQLAALASRIARALEDAGL